MADITIKDLERLVRDSERLAVVTDYVKTHRYIDKDEITTILGTEKETTAEEMPTEEIQEEGENDETF